MLVKGYGMGFCTMSTCSHKSQKRYGLSVLFLWVLLSWWVVGFFSEGSWVFVCRGKQGKSTLVNNFNSTVLLYGKCASSIACNTLGLQDEQLYSMSQNLLSQCLHLMTFQLLTPLGI